MNIPIYVITTKFLPDRHESIRAQLFKLGLQFEFVMDYDPDDLTKPSWASWDSELSARSASNVMKHMEAQRRLLGSGRPVGLVLEDDAILFESFSSTLELILKETKTIPSGWLIFLGGADNRIPADIAASNSQGIIEHPITTAEAYLIDSIGCQRRFEWLATNTLDRQADHQLKIIDESTGIKQFWVHFPVVSQGSITGAFATTLDASRARRSLAYLRFRYLFNRFRKQLAPRFLEKIKRKIRPL